MRALVTGACGGIGRAIVAEFAAIGASVGACDLQAVLDHGLPEGAVAGAAFDLHDAEAIRSGVAAIGETLGGLDVLVANAGVVDTIHRAVDLGAAFLDTSDAYGAGANEELVAVVEVLDHGVEAACRHEPHQAASSSSSSSSASSSAASVSWSPGSSSIARRYAARASSSSPIAWAALPYQHQFQEPAGASSA